MKHAAAGHRLVWLDVLRMVAVVMVLGHHFVHTPEAPTSFRWQAAGPLLPFSLVVHRIGWSGVDLFFVLSGFLIGSLLFTEIRARGSLDIGRFIVRRGFKIWPSYYVYLGFVATCLVLGVGFVSGPAAGPGEAFAALWPSLANVQNYYPPIANHGHLWSLAVEEHFYLGLPLLLALSLRLGRGRLVALPATAAVIGLACLLGRLVASGGEFNWFAVVPLTHLRIDSLFFGVFLAYLNTFNEGLTARLAAHPRRLAAAGFALLAPALALGQTVGMMTYGLTLLYLGYGCLVFAAVRSSGGPAARAWPVRAVAALGAYSYPIYLWHGDLALYPTTRVFRSAAFWGWPDWQVWVTAWTFYMALAVGFGALMSVLVERPALALRDRCFPARSGPSAVTEAAANGPEAARDPLPLITPAVPPECG